MNDKRKYDAVWCLVLFDLPVQTIIQRRQAAQFRKMLQDAGYSMIQFSVYGKYSPSMASNLAVERFLKANLPEDGEVRILHLTDTQWSSMARIESKKAIKPEEAPQQLTIF